MSTNSPIPSTKRNQRRPKSSNAPRSQPQNSESKEAMPTTSTPNKPKKKSHPHQNPNPNLNESDGQIQRTSSPLTPPRAPSQSNTTGEPGQVNNGSNNSRSRTRNRKNGNGKNAQTAPDTPASRQSRSPQPEYVSMTTPPTLTPAKPVQIYAGPTFHASPAASALPIPKLFSKSLPQVNDKKASFKAMMQDLSESSSSNEEESPTLRNAVRAEEVKRDESPLDIFFRADREEKARRQIESPGSSLSTPMANSRAQSASPAARPTHHSRHPTANSIFPLELDNAAPAKPPSHRFESSPSILVSHDQSRSGDNKAKTEALKQLLLFPKQQQQQQHNHNMSAQGHSFSPSQQRPASHGQISSDPTKGGPLSYNSPYANHSFSAQTRSTSQLRQELLNNTQTEPSTPTPPRTQNKSRPNFPVTASSESVTPRHNSPRRPVSKFQAEDALRASLGNPSTSAASTELMEDQLRKILKLDTLPSTGVRS